MKNDVSNLGLGVLIHGLSDNSETVYAIRAVLEKQISALSMSDDALHISVEGGPHIKIWDDGQSCCERRYMMTDDDLPYFVGATLQDIELRDAPNEPHEWGEHEVQFLVITTSKGAFTMATHNEHNGYYGGFAIEACVVDTP